MSDKLKPMVVVSMDVLTVHPVIHLKENSKIFVKEPNSNSALAAEQWIVNYPEGTDLQPFLDSLHKQQTVKVDENWLEHVRVSTE